MQVPYSNDLDHPVHLDGKRIEPGETRLVEESLVRRPRAPAAAEEPDGGSVLDLLDGRADDVAAALPELSDAQLQDLLAAEENGKTRKTVVAAIREEQLRRADAGDGSDHAADRSGGEGGEP